MKLRKMKFETTSEPTCLAVVRERVRAFLAGTPMDENERYLVVMAIDEACSNIIRHAYEDRPGEVIVVEMVEERGGMVCRLRDYGKRTDPALFRVRPMNEGKAGGMGWHLMHHAFDEVDYVPMRRGTELRLRREFREVTEGWTSLSGGGGEDRLKTS